MLIPSDSLRNTVNNFNNSWNNFKFFTFALMWNTAGSFEIYLFLAFQTLFSIKERKIALFKCLTSWSVVLYQDVSVDSIYNSQHKFIFSYTEPCKNRDPLQQHLHKTKLDSFIKILWRCSLWAICSYIICRIITNNSPKKCTLLQYLLVIRDIPKVPP